jgi:hypothetical protein
VASTQIYCAGVAAASLFFLCLFFFFFFFSVVGAPLVAGVTAGVLGASVFGAAAGVFAGAGVLAPSGLGAGVLAASALGAGVLAASGALGASAFLGVGAAAASSRGLFLSPPAFLPFCCC